ncbi:MAG: hypothetical protein ACE5FL_03570 [Myxococcota bacterium]
MYCVVPKSVRVWLSCGGLALALPLPAASQVTREFELPELEREAGLLDSVQARLTIANRFVGNADFGTFEAKSNQPEATLRITIPVTEHMVVRVRGTGRMLLYDWDGTSNLPGAQRDGDPFGDLYSFGTRIQAAYLFDENWTLFSDKERWAAIVQGGVKAAWEDGSTMRDGLKSGGGFAIGYRWGDRFEGILGVSVSERLLKSGLSVGPMVEFDWKISDKWSLNSYGLGLQLERAIGPDLRLFTRARLESSSYRLDDRAGAIGSGSVNVRQLPLGFGVRWDVGIFRVRAAVGVMFLQRLKLRDGNSNSIGSETAGPSPYFMVRVDLRS